MFWFYFLKEMLLARRNMFFLLIAVLPVLTSLAGAGLISVYSETPKIVLLEGDGRGVPEGIKAIYLPDQESVYRRVRDIDAAIGIINNQIITDGRESEAAVSSAQNIAVGSGPKNRGEMSEESKRKILAYSLFAAFTGATALILKMVEERENNTVDLYKTEPSPDLYPIGAKILVSAILGSVGFAISTWILRTPGNFITLALLYILGMGLGSAMTILIAYFSKDQSQAIALLKPFSVFLIILPPTLGMFFGGIMHKIALITPFYWLLQLIYSIYNGAFAQQYFIGLVAANIIGFMIIGFTWHQSPYGRKRSNA